VLGKGPTGDLPKADLVPHQTVDYPLLDRNREMTNPFYDTRKDISTLVALDGTQERKGNFPKKFPSGIVKTPTIQLTEALGKPGLRHVDNEAERSCDLLPDFENPPITCEQAIIPVEASYPPGSRSTGEEICGKVEGDLVQQAQKGEATKLPII
jgi:hypothetical protein